MNNLWFIMRMLRRRRVGGIPFARLAVGGVAVGIAILVITLSIIDGFATAYRDGLVRFHAPVLIVREDEHVDQRAVETALAAQARGPESDAIGAVEWSGWLRDVWWWGNWKYSEWTWGLRRVPLLEHMVGRLNPRHVVESLPLPAWFVEWRDAWHQRVRSIAEHGVTAAGPFLYREGLVIGQGVIRGIALRGMRPRQITQLQTVRITLTDPHEDLVTALSAHEGPLPVLIGAGLAAQVGTSDVQLFLPQSRTKVSATPYLVRIVGTFESGIHEFDAQFAFVDLQRLQALYGLHNVVTGYEVQIDHLEKASWIADALRTTLGTNYVLQDWRELHRETFEAVALEKILFGLIMGILVVIACANIVTAMLLRILLQYRSVAVLHAMGMSRAASRRLYFWQGTVLGMLGVTVGVLVGSGLAWLVGTCQWISIAPEIYFLSHVPVHVSPWTLSGIALFGLIVVTWAAARASRRGAQLPLLQALGRGYAC